MAPREPDTGPLEPATAPLEPDTDPLELATAPLEPDTALREPDTGPQRTRHSQAPRHTAPGPTAISRAARDPTEQDSEPFTVSAPYLSVRGTHVYRYAVSARCVANLEITVNVDQDGLTNAFDIESR